MDDKKCAHDDGSNHNNNHDAGAFEHLGIARHINQLSP